MAEKRRVTRHIGGWEWVCVTPGVKWEVSSGQYLFRTDGGWWLISPEYSETRVSEGRNLLPAMQAAVPLLAASQEERDERLTRWHHPE